MCVLLLFFFVIVVFVAVVSLVIQILQRPVMKAVVYVNVPTISALQSHRMKKIQR